MTLGAFISSGFAGVAANKFGRRQCLWIACVTCCVANIIMMTTTHIGALYVGRLVIGLANGYFMTFSQLYIQESSTAEYRGLFLTGFQFFTSFVSSSAKLCIVNSNFGEGYLDRKHCRLGHREETQQLCLSHSARPHLRRPLDLVHWHVLHSREPPLAYS